MHELANKQILVAGLDEPGYSAGSFLLRRHAVVTAVDPREDEAVQRRAKSLKDAGAAVFCGKQLPTDWDFELAVVDPALDRHCRLMEELEYRNVPRISELELGFQQARCLAIAIAGTNGRSTAAGLVEALLQRNGRLTRVVGDSGSPVCSAVEMSKELDFLTIKVDPRQLELTQFFRPAIAVLLNIHDEEPDLTRRSADIVRAKARLFLLQQAFDWGIVQSEALARIRSLNLPVPCKTITFSANNRRADLFLDRGLIISQISGWSGPLVDIDHCRLRGPHHAENLMAALALGRILRCPLEEMLSAVRDHPPRRFVYERVGESGGVTFINDAMAQNLAAVEKAVEGIPTGHGGEANVCLIAGGEDGEADFHDLGPLLAQRVKQVFLIGESQLRMRAAWSLFTPCVLVDSLLEAVRKAAHEAVAGEYILFSPGRPQSGTISHEFQPGEAFNRAVESICKTTGCGSAGRSATRRGARTRSRKKKT